MKENRVSNDQAKNIVKQYILNCNPVTGEILEESKKLDPILIKSLETLINPTFDELKEAINEKCGYPKRRGFSWTRDEDLKLINSFHKKVTIRDMSKDHQRSMTAISARLKHLKLIDDVIDFPRVTHRKFFSIGY